MVGATRAEFTVTVTAFEETTEGIPELSITWSLKCHVPVVDKAPVEILGSEQVVQLKELPNVL